MDTNTESFYHWLAGYADGEGCFSCAVYIPKGRTNTQIVPAFTIGVRADELPTLKMIQERTGIGSLYFIRQAPNNPRWTWRVATKDDCMKLVELFERYPLRAKKARDFAVWSQIIREHKTFNPRGGNSLDRIRELAAELSSGRKYDPQYER